MSSFDVYNNIFQVIKNPVTDHLPTGCKKIGTSFQGISAKTFSNKWCEIKVGLKLNKNPFILGELVSDIKDLVPKEEPIVLVIGAFAHGQVCVILSKLVF